jgi:hypothetical protein
MRLKYIGLFIFLVIFTACVSIPRETITLSQALGNDLKVLHNSHRNMINIHFDKIKKDINSFIDDSYAPFVIHYVLNKELTNFKAGKPSLYGTIQLAGEQKGKAESETAIKEMSDFLQAAHKQIEKKRNELLEPITKQATKVITAVNQSYENAIYANSTLTGYLQSIRKVKKAQSEALSMIGLSGADTLITKTLVTVSEKVSEAIEKGKEIDIKSDEAYQELEKISDLIKNLINKK